MGVVGGPITITTSKFAVRSSVAQANAAEITSSRFFKDLA